MGRDRPLGALGPAIPAAAWAPAPGPVLFSWRSRLTFPHVQRQGLGEHLGDPRLAGTGPQEGGLKTRPESSVCAQRHSPARHGPSSVSRKPRWLLARVQGSLRR